MIVPLQPRPVEFGVDRGAFLECHIVDALRDEECVGEHPHRVRDDLVDPTTVAQELAALYVREPRPSVTVLPTGLVWKDPDHEVHGGEGELGLTQLQRVSVGRVSGRIRVVDYLPRCQHVKDAVEVDADGSGVVWIAANRVKHAADPGLDVGGGEGRGAEGFAGGGCGWEFAHGLGRDMAKVCDAGLERALAGIRDDIVVFVAEDGGRVHCAVMVKSRTCR